MLQGSAWVVDVALNGDSNTGNDQNIGMQNASAIGGGDSAIGGSGGLLKSRQSGIGRALWAALRREDLQARARSKDIL